MHPGLYFITPSTSPALGVLFPHSTLPQSLKHFVVGTPGYASLHLAIVLGWAAIPVLTHPPHGDLNSTTTWFPAHLLSSYSITMLDTFKADALI